MWVRKLCDQRKLRFEMTALGRLIDPASVQERLDERARYRGAEARLDGER
jgi:hypothetical protein